MNRQTLPINEILVENRQRFDYGDIQSLAESIRANGLIQPIVINQEKRLIAGGRRLQACLSLGMDRVDICYRETLSEADLQVLELEENIQRKDETWQEKCLAIAKIHYLKRKLSSADLQSWGQRETGEMLGVSAAQINFNLVIARELQRELPLPIDQRRYWACERFKAAWDLHLGDEQDKALAELAKRQKEQADANPLFEEFETDLSSGATPASQIGELSNSGSPCPDYDSAIAQYLSNPLNPPDGFDAYWRERQAYLSAPVTIPLSRRLFHGDSIEFMRANPGRFDHVITDIPYGIDMENLNQQNPHGGMQDIERVEVEHDVQYNKQLIADFFPAAFHCTKPNAFVITWADQMLWQYMYDCAIAAGFTVQRWPITWVKTSSCMNQCVQFNSTKNTEIAIVCRKKGATLAKQPQTSVITCGRDELSQAIRHPFAKPFECWRFLTEMVSLENQSILEPFAGGGSGVISMLKLNRNVIGVELSEKHYNELLENVKTLHYLPLNPNFKFI